MEKLPDVFLQSLGRTEVFVACSGSAAALADEFGVSHQVLVFREILFQVPGILQKTEVLLVSRMGHLNLGHSSSLPSPMGIFHH